MLKYHEFIQDHLLPIPLPLTAHNHTLFPLEDYTKPSSITIPNISFQQTYLHLIGMVCFN